MLYIITQMFSELKSAQSSGRENKKHWRKIMSKAGKLNKNPVWVSQSRRLWLIFWSHCSGGSADSEDFSLLHRDLKRLGRECLDRLASGDGLHFPGASRSNADVPLAFSKPASRNCGLLLRWMTPLSAEEDSSLRDAAPSLCWLPSPFPSIYC